MGAWGNGIRQDDMVCDVIAAFEDHLKQGKTVVGATSAILSDYDDELADEDDGPLVWIGLADMQWTYGKVESRVLNRVRRDLSSGRSLSAWREESGAAANKRRNILEKFIAKIEHPNPRPKGPPRRIVRKLDYSAGDCLAIQFADGRYGAAFVLAEDRSNSEYPMVLIAMLDYLSASEPTTDAIAKRNWLHIWTQRLNGWNKHIDLCWYGTAGFRKVKDCIRLIGNIRLKRSDPKESSSHSPWTYLTIDIREKRKWGLGGSKKESIRKIQAMIQQFKTRCEYLRTTPPDEVSIRDWAIRSLTRDIRRLQAHLRRLCNE